MIKMSYIWTLFVLLLAAFFINEALRHITAEGTWAGILIVWCLIAGMRLGFFLDDLISEADPEDIRHDQ